jgi:hypothetical protein
MTAQRERGYAYRVVSYVEAYLPSERPTVSGLRLGAGGADLTVVLDGAHSQEHRVSVPPDYAEHELRVNALAGAPQTFRTVRAPGAAPIFASASLLRSAGSRISLRQHVAEVADYPEAHVTAVRKLLAEAALPKGDTTLERFAHLWLWLDGKLRPHSGQPPPDYQSIAPFDQFVRATRGEMKLFCANYSEILTLFATVAGHSIRIVDATGIVDDTPLSAHTFVELYVPELGRFVYSDLTLGIFAVRLGVSGSALDSGHIVQVQQMGGEEALQVEIVRSSALVQVPLREAPTRLGVFLNPNATFVFHQQYRDRFTLLERAKRYALGGEPAYSLVDDGRRYRVRMLVQSAAFVHAILTLALLVRWMRPGEHAMTGPESYPPMRGSTA